MSTNDQDSPTAANVKAEPQPQCPKCAITGTDYVVSRKGGTSAARGKQFVLAPFQIVFCSECGHVYGVTAASF